MKKIVFIEKLFNKTIFVLLSKFQGCRQAVTSQTPCLHDIFLLFYFAAFMFVLVTYCACLFGFGCPAGKTYTPSIGHISLFRTSNHCVFLTASMTDTHFDADDC